MFRLLFSTGFILLSCSLSLHSQGVDERSFSLERSRELPIPEELLGERSGQSVSFTVDAQRGKHRFYANAPIENTNGYDTDYLGPVLRFNYGDQVKITVNNRLRELTTLHWHGLLVPSAVDGDMRQTIQMGSQRTVNFNIYNRASTNWFHPHTTDLASDQVYLGLSGLIYIDEPNDPVTKQLPHTYGEDDIPLILQDRRFERNGRLRRRWNGHMVESMGRSGNVLLANGIADAKISVRNRLLRLRILNASNDSVLEIRLSDGNDFSLIANDGGLLTQEIKLSQLMLSPADRSEIVLDFSSYKIGQKLDLEVKGYGRREGFRPLPFDIIALDDNGSTIPQQLNANIFKDKPAVPTNVIKRDVVMRTGGMMNSRGTSLSINGKTFKLGRIDFNIKTNSVEEWNVIHDGSMGVPHTLHVHGVHFEVLSVNGRNPPPELSGLQDNVVLLRNDKVKLRVFFPPEKGQYLFHCHLLEHGENGMMAWLKLV